MSNVSVSPSSSGQSRVKQPCLCVWPQRRNISITLAFVGCIQILWNLISHKGILGDIRRDCTTLICFYRSISCTTGLRYTQHQSSLDSSLKSLQSDS